MKITTARDEIGVRSPEEHHAWTMRQARGTLRVLGLSPARIGRPEAVDQDAAPAIARINFGRWIADCPAPFCASASYVEPGHPYLCADCLNVDVGHQYRPVLWPADRGPREETLLERPARRFMNAYAHETVAQLRAETRTHRDRGWR